MAIRLIDRYPNRANAATADYPHGSGRNKSDPTADDGTPFDEDRFNDQEAFLQGLLTYAGITPSGTVDTVQQSDYLDALAYAAGRVNPEHADGGGTDAFASATNTAVPDDGVQIVRDFQSANTTTTPTLDGKTITDLDGNALWSSAISGPHTLQRDQTADTYLLLDPRPTTADASNSPVRRNAAGQSTFTNPTAASHVVIKQYFENNARVVQHRSKMNYYTADSVSATVPENLVMAGFRFMGSYRNGAGRYISSGITQGWVQVSEVNDLAVEDTVHAHNWYAVFAVANDADSTVTYVLMPFFRAGTVSGSTIPFAQGGETDGDTVTTTTYSGLATDELAGADVLVIQESKVFSGRTTTVTANTDADVTVNTIGSIAPNDFFLVAPPGWDDYVYLGSYYHDSAEPRNMADTGREVGSTGSAIQGLPASGEIVNATRYTCAGQVSPLATAGIYRLDFSIQSTGSGAVSHKFWHDSSSHVTQESYEEKYHSNTENYIGPSLLFPFSFEQALWIKTTGSLDNTVVSRQMSVRGWLEP